jgi:uncharacterized protein YjbI with pentapeptide repeats
MTDEEQVRMLREGATTWNRWRESNPDEDVLLSGCDLSHADLRGADLSEVEFWHCNLSGADLREADLSKADLSEANLTEADLSGADLTEARLRKTNLSKAILTKADLSSADLMLADLSGAYLNGASLHEANLSGANVSGANLTRVILFGAKLVKTNLTRANLSGADLSAALLINTVLSEANLTDCQIHGISAWDVNLEGAIQSNLIISTFPTLITVDNLELAQFLYLLLNSDKVRHVIDTITSKVVLILGRFTPERKAILDAIRDELRKRDYLPVLFDFEKPSNRDITETVSTLAHMARFVIADITDAKSIPQELMAIVPALPSVPVQPLLLVSQQEYGMFEHFRRFPWVLEPFLYEDQEGLLTVLTEKVIGPAEKKVKEQMGR